MDFHALIKMHRLPGPKLLLFLVLLALYLATACRTVGPGDSGELIAVMCGWGVAHAPAFPLFVLAGNVLSHLVQTSEPAFALNLMCSLFSALACVALAHAVTLMTGRPWAGFAAGLMLGTSAVFWQYALVTEVFGLNALMAALLLLLLARVLRGIEERRPVLWPLPLLALVMSTSITHHLTLSLLALPVLVVLAVQSRPLIRSGVSGRAVSRTIAWSVVAGLSGLVLLLYIPLAARHDPPLNWGDVRDIGGLMRVLLRQDFGTGMLTPPYVVVDQILKTGERASPLGMRHFGFFWRDLPQSFGWLFPMLAACGLIWVARRSRPVLLLSVLFAVAIVFFFTRVNAPVVPLYLGITRPFYILPHVFLAFLGGLGLAWLMERAAKLHRAAPVVLGAFAIAGTGLAMMFAQWSRVDMRMNAFTRDFGANLIAGMPARAIFLSNGDLFRNSFFYQQTCLGRRPDITLVEQSMMAASWYVRQLRRRRALALPETMTMYTAEPNTQSKAWLDLNLKPATDSLRRPIVAVSLIDGSYASDYRLLSVGLWSEVVRKNESVDVFEWANRSLGAARRWAVASLARDYPETSWEGSEGIFYPYALGRLRALLDMASAADPARSDSAEVPALREAERWRGHRRAEYLAYQADFWQTCITDSLFASRQWPSSLLATRAMALAESSLAIDPANLQALQTIAALRSTVARFRDPVEELRIRRRIVEGRPGDTAELVLYFRLVMSIMRDSALRDPALFDDAQVVRLRFVRLLEICMRCSNAPELAQLHQRWTMPLESAIAAR